jgi:predicted porin
VYELTGWANYSVLANTFGFGGYLDPRYSAQVKYQTPNFSGLSAELAYVFKADGAVIDNGANNQSDLWALNVVYDHGPIKAAATVSKTSNVGSSTNLYDPAGGAYGNANKVDWSLGGSYTFGNTFALSVSYNHANSAQRWQGAGGEQNFGARRYGWELGGSVFLGQFVVTLDLTRDTKNDLYGGAKYTNGVLEGKYNLSKRTFLYGDYLRLDGCNNYGIGISHIF